MPQAYENAGVSVEAGYEVVKRIKSHVARTDRLGVVSGIGGFGGLFDLASLNYKVSIGYRTNYVQANPTVVADDAFGLNGNSKTIFVPSNAIAVEVRITSRDSIGGISSFNVNTTVNK